MLINVNHHMVNVITHRDLSLILCVVIVLSLVYIIFVITHSMIYTPHLCITREKWRWYKKWLISLVSPNVSISISSRRDRIWSINQRSVFYHSFVLKSCLHVLKKEWIYILSFILTPELCDRWYGTMRKHPRITTLVD